MAFYSFHCDPFELSRSHPTAELLPSEMDMCERVRAQLRAKLMHA